MYYLAVSVIRGRLVEGSRGFIYVAPHRLCVEGSALWS